MSTNNPTSALAARGRYVPPSQRAGYTPTLASSDLAVPQRPQWKPRHQPRQVFLDDLVRIFNHPRDSTLTFFSYPPAPTPTPEITRPAPIPSSSSPEGIPLPPSPPPPPPAHPLGHLVSYILVFPRAHPDWETKRELWTHTHADELVEDWQGERKNCGRPIPIFGCRDRRTNQFQFIDWWILEAIEVVEPHSEELKRMMQAKEQAQSFGRFGRTADAWAASLSTRWVKLKFSRAVGAFRDPITMGAGEGEKYILQIGVLDDELTVLEAERMTGV